MGGPDNSNNNNIEGSKQETKSDTFVLSSSPQYPEVGLSNVEVSVMCSFKAPIVEDDTRNSRAALNIVAVIDRSGSMGGGKLELVKTTLEFVTSQLKEIDHLSLVTFDDKIKTDLKLTKMTADGKTESLNAIKQVHSGGSTNLSGGLLEGLNIVRNHKSAKSDVSTVLLLTDGIANHGITGTENIVKAMKGCLQQIEGVCTVFTFGFGDDHDPDMLKGISEAGHGLFYFIKDKDAISGSFGDCLGGLLSVVGQNIRLKCEAINGAVIKSLHSGFENKRISPTSYEISLGDIYSEETRETLFTILLPESTETTNAPIMKFSVEYFDISKSTFGSCETTCSINRKPNATTETPNLQVAEQMQRVVVVSAMKEAKAAAEKKDFVHAQEILASVKQKVQISPFANAEMSKQLMDDITSTENDVSSPQNWQQGGNANLMGQMEMHSKQRSNQSKPSVYQNKKKKAMVSDSNAYTEKKK